MDAFGNSIRKWLCKFLIAKCLANKTQKKRKKIEKWIKGWKKKLNKNTQIKLKDSKIKKTNMNNTNVWPKHFLPQSDCFTAYTVPNEIFYEYRIQWIIVANLLQKITKSI